MSEDKIIQKLLEHDEQLSRVVTKDEFGEFKKETLQNQEEMITILKRLDQERIFTIEWVKRIEKEVEEHHKEIEKMKLKLKVV